MSIRRLVIAALLASAGAAHADTIPTSASAQSTVVSGWTTGNGTDVLGSGVLKGNLNLVGGVAYSNGSASNASLSDVLYGKVAGTVGQIDGQTTLFFQRGIEAQYLMASGHGILAATLGPGVSVVGSSNGAVISSGVKMAPGLTGGGSSTAPGAGTPVSSGSTGGTSAPVSTGPTTGTGTNVAIDVTGSVNTGTNNGADNGNQGGIITIPGNGGGLINNPGIGNGNGQVEVVVGPGAVPPAGEVPEPSSIALMLAGMMGAGALSRRRKA